MMSFLEVGIHRMKFCSAANMDCFFPSASSISFFALDLLPIELTCFATADTRWIRTKRIYSCAHFLVPTRASKSKNSSTQLAKNLALALTTQHGRSFLSNSPRPTNKTLLQKTLNPALAARWGVAALARLFLAATEGTRERERDGTNTRLGHKKKIVPVSKSLIFDQFLFGNQRGSASLTLRIRGFQRWRSHRGVSKFRSVKKSAHSEWVGQQIKKRNKLQSILAPQGSSNFRGKNTKTIFQATGISWQVHNTLFTGLFLACGDWRNREIFLARWSQRARTRRKGRCCFGSGPARGDTPGPARVRLSGRRCLKHPARPGLGYRARLINTIARSWDPSDHRVLVSGWGVLFGSMPFLPLMG